MAKTKLGSNAQFSSVGKHLNIIGDRVYGYSGAVVVQSSALPLFDAFTGPGYIVCQIGIFTAQASTNNAEIVVSLNGLDVIAFEVLNTTQGDYLNGFAPMDLIIPPLSEFKLTAQNTASSSDMTWYATVVGRLYE